MRKLIVGLTCFVFIFIPIRRDYRYYTCQGYLDYYLPTVFNTRCTYNDKICEIPPRIIARNGFKLKEYKAETDDGFILNVIRISYINKITKKGVVYLQHPFTTDCQVFIDKGRNMSLGLLLADKGYDVWMGNSRGTRLSLAHKELTTKDPKYWDYSYHEIAIYDIPAALRLVKKITQAGKITYIGYSGGSTAALIYASLLNDHAKDTINLFITIAPSSYMNYPTFPVWFFFPATYVLKFLADTFGEENSVQTIAAITRIGAYSPILLSAVTDIFQFTPDQKHPPWIPQMACSIFQSVNSKQLIHYIQMERAKRFQRYDYGSQTNKKIYGRKRPTEYPVSNIEVPFQIIYSSNDAFFGREDAWLLYNKMRGVTRKHKLYNAGSFNHFDFAYGKGIADFYRRIVKNVDAVNIKGNKSGE